MGSIFLISDNEKPGIQMAQARCAHRPSVVGFIAPPIERHRQQGGGNSGAPGRHKLHNQRTPSTGSSSP
nr:hypothetical protein Iba_chr12aCG6710 [Ipomoea batatas]